MSVKQFTVSGAVVDDIVSVFASKYSLDKDDVYNTLSGVNGMACVSKPVAKQAKGTVGPGVLTGTIRTGTIRHKEPQGPGPQKTDLVCDVPAPLRSQGPKNNQTIK